MVLASIIHNFNFDIDNNTATKKFLALYNRTTLSRVRMAKFLQDNFSNELILSCNAKLETFYHYKMHMHPDKDDLVNWIKNTPENINLPLYSRLLFIT